MARTLKVGIIGASPDRGWARVSHVPAVQAVDGLELHAVATQDAASAERAAAQYGAARGYGDARALIGDPQVDVVTVAVNVPAHRELVLAAVEAGKHVLCEFPLDRDADGSGSLAEAARNAGVRAAVGLQARCSPAVVEAVRRLRDGALGRILSVRVLSTTVAFGPQVERAMAFGEDAANGVTLSSIQGAHTLDLLERLVGEVQAPAVLASTRFPTVEIEGEGPRRRTTFDHLSALGRVRDGAPVTLEVAGARPPGATPFLLEMTGEAGALRLEGGAARGFQSGALQLRVDGALQATPPTPATGPETACNVSALYAALRDDVLHGGDRAPSFADGVRAQTRLAALLAAA